MSSFLPAVLALLGLCMFALSLWFQEGSIRSSGKVESPLPVVEKVEEASDGAPPEALETVPVALEWTR